MCHTKARLTIYFLKFKEANEKSTDRPTNKQSNNNKTFFNTLNLISIKKSVILRRTWINAYVECKPLGAMQINGLFRWSSDVN